MVANTEEARYPIRLILSYYKMDGGTGLNIFYEKPNGKPGIFQIDLICEDDKFNLIEFTDNESEIIFTKQVDSGFSSNKTYFICSKILINRKWHY